MTDERKEYLEECAMADDQAEDFDHMIQLHPDLGKAKKHFSGPIKPLDLVLYKLKQSNPELFRIKKGSGYYDNDKSK